MSDVAFAFGKNWLSYAAGLTDARIAQARSDLERLVGSNDLRGKSFLDIGSGSGLSSLVARQLGAQVTSFDADADSVACTAAIRNRFYPDDDDWQVTHGSVLDRAFVAELGRYDIVYSWGVLHHTGDVWRAIAHAALAVKPGGLLVLALYRRTRLCHLWTHEKRFYAHAPKAVQAVLRGGYKLALLSRIVATGQNPLAYVRTYRLRGMDWDHDVHDWLGGYPYEPVSRREVEQAMAAQGFTGVAFFGEETPGLGLFGSGCDEFVFRN